VRKPRREQPGKRHFAGRHSVTYEIPLETIHGERSVEAFLKSTEIVDWKESRVLAKARELSAGASEPREVAQRHFEWDARPHPA
jgi:hypothetical protein